VITGLFFGISLLCERQQSPGLLCLAAFYLVPFLLGLSTRRLWTAWPSPLAYLATVLIWELTHPSRSAWYDVGPAGWAIEVLLLFTLPMLSTFGLGRASRTLLGRWYRRKRRPPSRVRSTDPG